MKTHSLKTQILDRRIPVWRFKVRRSQLSQFAVSVWRSQLSQSQVWGFKVLSFRSFNFEVSTLISHFQSLSSVPFIPFVSLAFSDDIRTLELLDKQLRFRHCRLLLYETSDDDSQSALALTLSANDSLADESTHAVFRAVTLLFRLNRGYSELNLLVSARSTVSAHLLGCHWLRESRWALIGYRPRSSGIKTGWQWRNLSCLSSNEGSGRRPRKLRKWMEPKINFGSEKSETSKLKPQSWNYESWEVENFETSNLKLNKLRSAKVRKFETWICKLQSWDLQTWNLNCDLRKWEIWNLKLETANCKAEIFKSANCESSNWYTAI